MQTFPTGKSITFGKRDFSGPLLVDGLSMQVERLSWRALGGPWTARIRVSGDSLLRLWALTDLLRCPMTVCDALGPAWWGYVSAVEIHTASSVLLRCALDEMANRVAVSYHEFTPNDEGGHAAMTAFAVDAASVSVYGEKEQVFEMGQASAAGAAAYAATQLARVRKPTLQPKATDAPIEGMYAILEARGWWDTLNWKFYQQPRGLIASPSLGADQKVGDTTQVKAAQTFASQADPWLAAELWLRARRVGAPTDALKVELCLNNGGIPGAVLGAAQVNYTAVADDWGWVRFVFATPVLLSSTSAHWIVVSRTGTTSAANYYMVGADQANTFAGGSLYVYTTAWAARSPAADLSFTITGVEETTEQIRRMVSVSGGAMALPCGQFLPRVRIEQASGVSTRLYRDGSQRGQDEVEALLKMGTAGAARLLARVEPDRTTRIYAQPSAAAPSLTIGADGQIRRIDGRALPPSQWPAGQWARLGELSPSAAAWESAVLFIESCEWHDHTWKIN